MLTDGICIKTKQLRILALLLWGLIACGSIALFHNNTTMMFDLIKMDTFLCVVLLTANLAFCVRRDFRELFYVIIFCLLTLFLMNYVINFVSHYYSQGLTEKYIGEYILKIASLICSCVCVIIFKCKLELHKAFIVTALIIGCSYMFVLTPMSAPDEDYHFHSSYVVSNYLLFEDDKTIITKEHENYEGIEPHYNVSSAYKRFSDSMLLDKKEINDVKKITGRYSTAYPIQHLPQAIGVSVARSLHMNFLGVFYAGRLFNLLFYISCVYLAIKKLPAFKEVLFIAAIMPMPIHQAASCSSDGFINGMSFLLISMIVSVLVRKNKISKMEIAKISIVTVLLAPAKVIYVLVAFLIFLIPAEQFGGNKKKTISIIVILGSGIFVVLLFKLQALLVMAGQHTAANSWATERYYSISDILNNPQDAIKIYVDTLLEKGTWYLETMLGSTLSGLSIAIPKWQLYLLEFIFIITSLLQPNDTFVFSVRDRIYMFCIFAFTVVLVMTSMLLGWTPINYEIIEGVQGRYFIPVMPLLLFSLRNNTIISKRNISEYLIVCAFVIHYLVLGTVINYTF